MFKAEKLLLIRIASLNLLSSSRDFAILSEPAKSTKLIVFSSANISYSLYFYNTLILKTVCDLSAIYLGFGLYLLLINIFKIRKLA